MMKVYHPTTGEVYEGDPVDCRDLMRVAGWVTTPKPPEEVKADDAVRAIQVALAPPPAPVPVDESKIPLRRKNEKP